MKLGFFAPLPPARSGVADHAAELLPVLRSAFDVNIGRTGDLNLYHVGNNQLHAGIYRQALREPGIVVLHDAVLHHFALGYFDRQQYVEEFMYNYGSWSRDLAEELWAGRARSAADPRYFRYPLLRRIVQHSNAVIVHNPAAARIVREHVPSARVFETPLLWTGPAASNIPYNSRLLCGLFGHLRESKRLPVVIEACRRAEVDLIIAGDLPQDLRRALGLVHCEPYGTRSEFFARIAAVECCINLRWPPAGETSAIGVQSMGAGKTVIFTDGEEIARYPQNACVRIEPGLGELDHLTDVLLWLRSRRTHTREIGAQAAQYIRAEHSAERVLEVYRKALVN